MKQDAFERIYGAQWQSFEHWLRMRAKPTKEALAQDMPEIADAEFPAVYRKLCQQLSIAKRRGYSPALISRLQELVDSGHGVFYRPPPPRLRQVVAFFTDEFPALVRQQWRFMSVAFVLFFGPLILLIALLQYRPEIAHAMFDAEQLTQFETMYNPETHAKQMARDGDSDLEMFGYYVMNNISIGFRTFASGLLAGIGAIIVLLSNGIVIGGVAGHLTAIGSGVPFWSFVSGHSAPELLGIVVSGGAGLQLGWALIAPGRKSRQRALIDAALIGAKLVAGVFTMLLLAAFIEAFWSARVGLPPMVKYVVGIGIWVFFALYFWRGGKNFVVRTDDSDAIDA
jgi:uncharacterized membrane protein SpoIIM required for sporulation